MANLIEILEFMPVGVRFKPTDEELINHYLENKIRGEEFLDQMIPEIELCKHEPWDLPALSVVRSADPEWFFFSRRDKKYSNSKRSNRATVAGYWKPTGRERNIKTRGTNNVIGTKKTLVFYTGRVPHGVKTDWVVHEYNAETFPPHERTFVVCRLMRKSEHIEEERSNALVSDEGEPRNVMASDYENLVSLDIIPDVDPFPAVNLDSTFQGMPQADEYDLLSIQPSALCTGQETSFQNSPFPSINFGNETTEEEDNIHALLNSFLADEDVYVSKERQHAFVHDSTPSELLRMGYYESSDTDAEVVSRYGNVLDTSTASNQHAGSREYRVMKMVKTSHGAANSRTQLASRLEASRKNRGSILFGDSSGGFTSDEPSINCIQISSSPSPPRRYSPVSVNLAQQVASRRQLQRKASRKEKSKDEVKNMENPFFTLETDVSFELNFFIFSPSVVLVMPFSTLMYCAGSEGSIHCGINKRPEKSSRYKFREEFGSRERSVIWCQQIWFFHSPGDTFVKAKPNATLDVSSKCSCRVFFANSDHLGFDIICQMLIVKRRGMVSFHLSSAAFGHFLVLGISFC